jgi:hypothetical protein
MEVSGQLLTSEESVGYKRWLVPEQEHDGEEKISASVRI